MALILLVDTQKVSLAIKPVNKKGNPAPLDGVPQWSSSDPNVIAVTPAADGLSCVASAGATGTATVSVTADADLGAGVTPLAGTVDFDVKPGPAVSLGITTGTPEEQ